MKKILCVTACVLSVLMVCTFFSIRGCKDSFYPESVSVAKLFGGKQTKAPVSSPMPTPEPHRLMYQPDGTVAEINLSQQAEYLEQGWYDVPVMTVYALGDREMVIPKKEFSDYSAVGWYDAPVMTVYTLGDKETVIYQSEWEAHKQVGWYSEPVTMVYTVEKSQVILKTELTQYLNNGWYRTKEEVPVPVQPEGTVSKGESFAPGTKLVALTFDDGPGKYTNAVLDCLQAHGAKATFFVVGTGVKAYPNVLKRAYDMGMEIGNHTMNHKNLKALGAEGVKSQLQSAENLIVAATGVKPTLIRPPYGNYNETVKSVANAPLILWSIDTLDWKTKNAQSTVNTIMSKVKDGAVVLMHDIHAPTLEAVKQVVPRLVQQGYHLVTVSELARAKGVSMGNGKTYSSFKS